VDTIYAGQLFITVFDQKIIQEGHDGLESLKDIRMLQTKFGDQPSISSEEADVKRYFHF
jgi:hypothetical protein